MIWNPDAIDYSKGVVLNENGTISGKVIGCWVMTEQEAKEALEAQQNGK